MRPRAPRSQHVANGQIGNLDIAIQHHDSALDTAPIQNGTGPLKGQTVRAGQVDGRYACCEVDKRGGRKRDGIVGPRTTLIQRACVDRVNDIRQALRAVHPGDAGIQPKGLHIVAVATDIAQGHVKPVDGQHVAFANAVNAAIERISPQIVDQDGLANAKDTAIRLHRQTVDIELPRDIGQPAKQIIAIQRRTIAVKGQAVAASQRHRFQHIRLGQERIRRDRDRIAGATAARDSRMRVDRPYQRIQFLSGRHFGDAGRVRDQPDVIAVSGAVVDGIAMSAHRQAGPLRETVNGAREGTRANVVDDLKGANRQKTVIWLKRQTSDRQGAPLIDQPAIKAVAIQRGTLAVQDQAVTGRHLDRRQRHGLQQGRPGRNVDGIVGVCDRRRGRYGRHGCDRRRKLR